MGALGTEIDLEVEAGKVRGVKGAKVFLQQSRGETSQKQLKISVIIIKC